MARPTREIILYTDDGRELRSTTTWGTPHRAGDGKPVLPGEFDPPVEDGYATGVGLESLGCWFRIRTTDGGRRGEMLLDGSVWHGPKPGEKWPAAQ